jgi:hypothetical protein
MAVEGREVSVHRQGDAGRGKYTDDINRPGQLHAYGKRSDSSIINAIRVGLEDMSMPATCERIWSIINGGPPKLATA